ncbi:hypothetical protein EPO05_00815, partial [Patescibacteria group bacterium]
MDGGIRYRVARSSCRNVSLMNSHLRWSLLRTKSITFYERKVRQTPRGPVATKLKWESLTEEEFERLIFVLIAAEHGYENPEWLMKTNAPDRGRDLSVYRVYNDSLGGTLRQRVIIQCKHWLSKSVSPTEIGTLKEQMRLWEP